MKTLSIVLMAAATSFGIFNFLNTKKSGVYDRLYQESSFHEGGSTEKEEINYVAALPELRVASETTQDKIVLTESPIPFTDKKDTPQADKNLKSTSEKKNDLKPKTDDLTAAEKAELDSFYTIDEIENYFAVDVDTLRDVHGFDFNPEIFSRGIPSKEEEHHYSLVSNFIRQKVLNWKANNNAAADPSRITVSTQDSLK